MTPINHTDKEIIRGLADGYTLKELAGVTKMSLFTLRTYKWRLMKKMDAKTTAHMIAIGFKWNIL